MPDASSVAQTLVNLGLSPLASAALSARAGRESSYNPTALGDNNTSYGLWQMHGPRYAALLNFAKAGGMDPADPNTQAKYVVSELSGSEKGSGDALRAATTPEQATAAVMGYERPAGYTRQNPMGGLGAAATLAATRALLGGAPTTAMASSDGPAGTSIPGMGAPSPNDPDPLQQVQPVEVPQHVATQAPAQPAANLGFSSLGQTDPAQQAQQAATALAQFMASQGHLSSFLGRSILG